MKPIFTILLLTAAAGAGMPAMAGTSRGDLPVTLTVAASCAIAAEPLAFGTIGSGAEDASAQAALTLNCTPGTPYAVALDGGRTRARRMTDSAGTVSAPYEIYQDAGGLRRWGNGAGTTVSGIAPAGGSSTLTAYGRLLDPASLPDGRYSDIVTVTIAF